MDATELAALVIERLDALLALIADALADQPPDQSTVGTGMP